MPSGVSPIVIERLATEFHALLIVLARKRVATLERSEPRSGGSIWRRRSRMPRRTRRRAILRPWKPNLTVTRDPAKDGRPRTGPRGIQLDAD
jgi:hypothetical protein